MLMLPTNVKVFLSLEPVSMRLSFNGLSLLVKDVLERDPFTGHLFVFINRRCDKVKTLYWDRNGFALWYKQLARGTFKMPRIQGSKCCYLSINELSLLLEGIDLTERRFTTIHAHEIN